MKKILITGGLGQVGSHIVDLLMEREVEIVVIDNLATGRKENLEEKENLKILFCDVSDKKKIHNNIFLMIALALSFHWSIIFALLFWLVPILKNFLSKSNLKFNISSVFSIAFIALFSYLMIRLNLFYKITTYLIENTENNLNTGQLSFFLPFLLIVLVKFFGFSNFSIKYRAKLHQIKSMINWALISSFVLYIFFISTQSLGISRITLSLYSIAIPMIAFAFLGSSPNKRQLILTAYLFLFFTIEMLRISKFINYITC